MKAAHGGREKAAWAVVKAAWGRFHSIDGLQRAAALSYHAFFALFPVILIGISAAAYFVEPGTAPTLVLRYIEEFIPPGAGARTLIADSVSGVVAARGTAGTAALLILVWIASQFFAAIINAVNQAWDAPRTDWWKLPAKSLYLLGITASAVVVAVALPVAARLTLAMLPVRALPHAAEIFAMAVLPWAAVFICLTFFYKLAPHRRTTYAEVRLAALCATLLLYSAQSLFVMYLKHFASLNAVYGAFGSVMALLLWIYLSGMIFIFCACLSAAQAAARGEPHA